MPRLENEKSLGDVNAGLSDRIDDACAARNNMKKKQFVTMGMEFFLALPEPLQNGVLMYRPDSKEFKQFRQVVARAIAAEQARKIVSSAAQAAHAKKR
jgi:hypothetical protein